jgi:DNA-binding transcriptional LysR family regulator
MSARDMSDNSSPSSSARPADQERADAPARLLPAIDTSQLTLWKLEIFCCVLEQQSFSRAARVLGVSQPTVSGHVTDLEHTFATRLFDRSAGMIVATRAGELLFEQGRKLMLLRDETVRIMHNLTGARGGDVTIGGSTIPATYVLPAYLAAFKHSKPHVKVTLRVGDSNEVANWILDGRIELGVIGSDPGQPLLRLVPLCRDELVIILPREHPRAGQESIAIADLTGEPLLLRERGSGSRALFERVLCDAGIDDIDALDIVCELGSTESIKEAVRRGLGVSLVSRLAVQRDIANGDLACCKLADIDLTRQLSIATHLQRTLSPIARDLLALLRSSTLQADTLHHSPAD